MLKFQKIRNAARLMNNVLSLYFFPQKVIIDSAVAITEQCNLHCIMCTSYNNGHYGLRRESMTFSQVSKIFAEFKLAGIKNLQLFGGEPTLHPNFKSIVNLAYSNDFCLSMVTNGTRLRNLDEETLKKFSKISVSVDSIQHYQEIRGKNLFKDVDKGIRRLKTLRIPTTIILTVQKSNYKEIEDVVAYCSKIGVSIFLQPVVPIKTAKKDVSDYDPDYVIRLIKKLSSKYPRTIVNKTSFLYHLSHHKIQKCDSCVFPIKTILIFVNGDVFSCCGLHPKILGNIFKKSLQKIRKENFPYFISVLNGKMPPGCKNCSGYITRKEYTFLTIKYIFKKIFHFS